MKLPRQHSALLSLLPFLYLNKHLLLELRIQSNTKAPRKKGMGHVEPLSETQDWLLASPRRSILEVLLGI